MTRDEFVTHLGEQYRRVLTGLGDEREFGRQLQRARLTEREMTAVVRIARGPGDMADLDYTSDPTEGGQRRLYAQEVW